MQELSHARRYCGPCQLWNDCTGWVSRLSEAADSIRKATATSRKKAFYEPGRWNPLRELEEMTDSLHRVNARPHPRRSNGKEMMPVADWRVSVDISESDWDFHIKTEFAGLKNEAWGHLGEWGVYSPRPAERGVTTE